jgi:hypothetical protein
MLELLTPLSKCVRVTRQIDPTTFVIAPGVWAYVKADGSIANQTVHRIRKINKMVITSASSNQYESQDIKAGRITTLEGPYGVRFKVDTAGYAGTIAAGDELIVSIETASAGKLIRLATATIDGYYPVVARAEQVDMVAGWIIAELIFSADLQVTGATTTTSTTTTTTTTTTPGP